MPSLSRRHAGTVGQSPGVLAYVGPDKSFEPTLHLASYDAAGPSEECCTAMAVRPELEPGKTHCLNLMGLHDTSLVKRLGDWFGLSALTMEDVLDTGQRPKAEVLENGDLFLILKSLEYLPEPGTLREEQVSVVWGENYLVTMQEGEQNVCEPLLQRVRRGKGRIRTGGSSYLLVALLDSLVDRASVTLGKLAAQAEALEDELARDLDEEALFRVYRLKREIIFMRNTLWPLHEALGQVANEAEDLDGFTGAYLRDVREHAAKLVDEVKTLHDLLSSLLDLQISLGNMRLNAVMKYLTGVATIFIPLSFIASVYGMNFESMPELKWAYGYPFALGLMLAVALGMGWYFLRKKWF